MTVLDRENEEGFLVEYDRMNLMDQPVNMESVTIKNQIFVFQLVRALDHGGVLIKVVHFPEASVKEADQWDPNMGHIMEDFKGHIFLL